MVMEGSILVRGSIAIKRHNNHRNYYEGKYLMGWIIVQRISPLLSGWDMGPCRQT